MERAVLNEDVGVIASGLFEFVVPGHALISISKIDMKYLTPKSAGFDFFVQTLGFKIPDAKSSSRTGQ